MRPTHWPVTRIQAAVVGTYEQPFEYTPAPSKPTGKSPSAQLRDLEAAVSGIAMLKDPFKSDLLGNLDAAIAALADHNQDEARAQLDQFVATVQKPQLQAELTSAQRDRLVAAAKGIQAQLGP